MTCLVFLYVYMFLSPLQILENVPVSRLVLSVIEVVSFIALMLS